MLILLRFMKCFHHDFDDVEILEVPQDEAQIYILEGILTNCPYLVFSGN